MPHIILTVTNDLVFDQRMQRIATTLKNKGYRVELVGRRFEHSKGVSASTYLQTRLKCFFNKGIGFYAEYNIRLFFFLLFNSFDIVCGCDLDTLPAAVLAAKFKQKKVVYDAHEYFPESPELVGRPSVKSVWKFIERIFVPHVDRLYTVNESIAQIFTDTYKVKCGVIFNYPVNETTIPLPSENSYLLYQGAVNVGRGLNEMLLTMLKINDLPFYIAGDGDEMQYIRSSIKELQLNEKVKMLGKMPPASLREVTHQAYIGINLLENRGLNYYYSLGNKTFDYIQSGIPQIMIGFPEYIALNKKYNIGLVVEELTVEKIESAIRLLIDNKELYNSLRENCFKAREELCWEKEEQKLLEVYNSLTV